MKKRILTIVPVLIVVSLSTFIVVLMPEQLFSIVAGEMSGYIVLGCYIVIVVKRHSDKRLSQFLGTLFADRLLFGLATAVLILSFLFLLVWGTLMMMNYKVDKPPSIGPDLYLYTESPVWFSVRENEQFKITLVNIGSLTLTDVEARLVFAENVPIAIPPDDSNTARFGELAPGERKTRVVRLLLLERIGSHLFAELRVYTKELGEKVAETYTFNLCPIPYLKGYIKGLGSLASALLLLMPIATFQRYVQLPDTRAERIYKRELVQSPASLYPQIYSVWIREDEPKAVFCHLSKQMRQSDREDVADIIDAFCALAAEPDDLTKPLEQAASTLAKGKHYDWGQEMHDLYRLFSAAYEADCITNLTALDLTVTADPVDDTYGIRSRLGETETLPPFLKPSVPITLTALERTADTLMKYEQVDTPTDKLAYLADGLNQIEEAAKSVEALTEPERTVLADITAKWREIIQKEIKAISGRAELRTELRTQQALFSERVGLVLRLENTGQAVAENVTVSLESSEEYEVIGEATVKLARVSTRRPSDVEFTIYPKRQDRVRLDLVITWDDREGQGKSRRFADTVSFLEVEREFTRIPNPYVAGNPITSPKLFFGREDVFDFVLENLVGAEQKNTLVLHGQRRTGKSSVLLQLRDRVLPQEFIPVYLNMEALPDVKTMEAFLARLAYEIGRAARKRGLELEVPADFDQPATAFDRFMDAAEDALSGQRFVLMFDEFELIESKIAEGMDAGVLNYFRNLMQFRDSLIFVFAGTHRLQEMTHDYWSILFSIALNREISFLGEEDTRRLITEPVQGSLEYDDLTIEKVIRVTHCQPYLVQLICWQLVNYLNGQQRNYATINDVNEVLDQTLVTAEAYFNSIWEQSTSHQRLALALLTGLLRPGKETVALSEVEKGLADKGVALTGHELIAALSELCRRDVLEERTNGELRYRFQIDLVRMWVEKNKPLSRVLIEEGL